MAAPSFLLLWFFIIQVIGSMGIQENKAIIYLYIIVLVAYILGLLCGKVLL